MNSTIKLKKKKCSCGCGKEGFIFSKGMIKECWARENAKPIKKVSDKRMEQEFGEESISNLIDDLDATISRYVRIRDSNVNGFAKCCTCPNELPYTEMDAGHFVPRANMSTRFNEFNIHTQCRICNRTKYGEQEKMVKYIEEKHEGMSDWLLEQARHISRPSISDLKELLLEYRSKLVIVQSKLKNNGNK